MAITVAGETKAITGQMSAIEDATAAAGFLRYLARQPILDGRGLHGYELLFRSGPASVAFCGDGNAATRSVLDHLMTAGLERLTGGAPAFVNCTQEALEQRLVLVLPPSKTVLEILETLEPTATLLHACREFKAMGYGLALDDFVWNPEWAPFIELTDYVKVDLSITTREQRAELLGKLRGSRARLVAERVETQADLQQARAEGFTLFQGYYFCRPVLMESRSIPANKMVQLEILKALQDDPLDTQHVSDLVKRDASLTYRLLRIVNSPLYGVGKEVRSIHSALVMVGDLMFRRVAMLAIAAELRGGQPSELLRMAFLRGRFCELAAARTGEDATEQYLLGILSLLPAMLRVSMENVVQALPLRAALSDALLGESNPQRTILDWVLSYEQGLWEQCDALAQQARLDPAVLPELYADATEWAQLNLSAALGGG